MDFYRFNTPLLEMAAGAQEDAVTRLWLPGMPLPDLPSRATPLLEETAGEVCDYLMGLRNRFDIPVRAVGTPFQAQVWNALCAIPFGQTRTYGQIALAVGRPGAARAVGMACRHNPLPILIPCHRVLGAKGKLTGYAGGLELKRALLAVEGA